MDYKELAKVADSISGKSKHNVPARTRQVVDEKNPLDALEDRDKIVDKAQKAIIIDDVFIKRLATASRDDRRKFLSRLTDSQRRRVLTSLRKVKDSGFSEKLGYILLDDLLSNVAFEPSESNLKNLDDFIETQNYTEFPEEILSLVASLKAGDVVFDDKALEVLESNLGDRESRFVAMLGKDLKSDTEFTVPEEEELVDEDIADLTDSAKNHVILFSKNRNFKEIVDAAEEIIAEFQGKNRSYAKTSAAYWECFEKAWKEQFKEGDVFETLNSKEILDSIDAALDVIQDEQSKLDTVFENPAIDAEGNEIKDVEDTSVIALLSEALEEFINGDDSKLEALAQQTLSTEVEDVVEEEPEEELDIDIDTDSDTESDEVSDSVVHFARRLKQNKRVNKLVDALEKVVPALSKVNFRKTDCSLPYTDVALCGSAIDMPLTCEEYNTLCPSTIPPVMEDMIEEAKVAGHIKAVPPVNSCQVDNGIINVNGGQLYYPLCPVDEFEARLNEAENNEAIQEIVSSCTVPLEDALHYAAKCDNLSFIDTRFYRPSFASKSWTFDENRKPACLEGCPEGSCIERCKEEKANCHLFGVPYVIS